MLGCCCFFTRAKKKRSKLSRILERFPVSGFQESLTVTHRGKMHWHTHMQVTLGVKVQSNCFQFFFCLFSPLEVGDASWYQPVLPHKRRTPAGIKPRSSALCCPAAGLIRSDAAFNSSQGSQTNNPFFFNDGGRLIRRYGWRGPADRTAGAAVMFTRSVGSVCSIYSVHLNVDCVCALGASCSRTNLLFLHNHISAWKGNFISGFCARVRDGFDVQKHVAAFFFFFPLLWNLSWKSMVKYFAEPQWSWSLYCLYMWVCSSVTKSFGGWVRF